MSKHLSVWGTMIAMLLAAVGGVAQAAGNSVSQTIDGLLYQWETDKAVYGLHETVTISLTVTNAQAEPYQAWFGYGPLVTFSAVPHGYVAPDASESPLWTDYPYGSVWPASFYEFTLAPGESVHRTATWDLDGPPMVRRKRAAGLTLPSDQWEYWGPLQPGSYDLGGEFPGGLPFIARGTFPLTIQVAPEPGTACALLLGAAGLALGRRRPRRA